MGYLASSICCIGGIAGLASQKTARIGNSLGIIGITGGMTTTLAMMNFANPVLVQALSLIGVGVLAGSLIGKKVAVTELP